MFGLTHLLVLALVYRASAQNRGCNAHAFHSTLSEFQHVGDTFRSGVSPIRVAFDTESIDDGNAFRQGVFTCPNDEIWELSTAIAPTGENIFFRIVYDEQNDGNTRTLMSGTTGDVTYQSTITSIVQCSLGGTAWVEVYRTKTPYVQIDRTFSSFSGVRVTSNNCPQPCDCE